MWTMLRQLGGKEIVSSQRVLTCVPVGCGLAVLTLSKNGVLGPPKCHRGLVPPPH